MKLGELIEQLVKLNQAGVSLDTPIVIPTLGEDETDLVINELTHLDFYNNTHYQVDNAPKMSVSYRKGDAVVLGHLGNDCWENGLIVKDHRMDKNVTIEACMNYISDPDIFLNHRRWHALMGTTAIRILGHSGCQPDEQQYAHFGMEVWTHHGPTYDNKYGRGVITAFADKMIRNLEAQLTMKHTVRTDWEYKALSAMNFKGANTDMTIRPKELVDFTERVDALGLDTVVMEIACQHGICEDCDVTLSYDVLPIEIQVYHANPNMPTLDWVMRQSNGTEVSLIQENYGLYALLEHCDGEETGEGAERSLKHYAKYYKRGEVKTIKDELLAYAKFLNLSGTVTVEPKYHQ